MNDKETRRGRTWRRGARAATLAAVAVLALVFAQATFAATTKTVRYGPYTIPGGSMEMPGMIHNQLSFAVPRPCIDCFITSFKPDLVYGDGTRANFNTGAMLHHAVWTSQFRSDATCSGTLLGLAGERFFATGNERTAISFPAGYGYRVRFWDSWNMLVDLMNMMPDPQPVYVQVTYTLESPWSGLKPLKTVWLDENECGNSEYTTPSGTYTASWSWTSNLTGDIVAAIGHQHDYGVQISATDTRDNKTICTSYADYPSPMDSPYMGHIDRMTTCTGTPVARIHGGDAIRLDSTYNNTTTAPLTDVMGIMLLYVNPA